MWIVETSCSLSGKACYPREQPDGGWLYICEFGGGCDEGDQKCDFSPVVGGSSAIKECKGGEWVIADRCGVGSVCVESGTKAYCESGSHDCFGDETQCYTNPGSKLHEVRVCSGGKWKTSVTCKSGQVCMVPDGGSAACFGGEEPECNKDGITQCSDDVSRVEICKAGKWVLQKHCAKSEICELKAADQAECVNQVSTWDFCEHFTGDPMPSSAGSGHFISQDIKDFRWDYENGRKASTVAPIDGFGFGTPGSSGVSKSSLKGKLSGDIVKFSVHVRSASSSATARRVEVKLGDNVIGSTSWRSGSSDINEHVYDVTVSGSSLAIHQTGPYTTIDDICWKLK